MPRFVYLFIVFRSHDIYRFHGLEEVGALEECESAPVSQHTLGITSSALDSDGPGPCLLRLLCFGDLAESCV